MIKLASILLRLVIIQDSAPTLREINKVLFGTLGNEDAKYYNEQIEHFEENSDDITKLMKQPLFVVKSSLVAINNTLTDMEYNEEKVELQYLAFHSVTVC
jgi:hypothetical protein